MTTAVMAKTKAFVLDKALLKTLSWRLVASTDTALLGWLITGNLTAGLSVAGGEVVTKMVLYYLHERAWNKAEEKEA